MSLSEAQAEQPPSPSSPAAGAGSAVGHCGHWIHRSFVDKVLPRRLQVPVVPSSDSKMLQQLGVGWWHSLEAGLGLQERAGAGV